MTDESKVKPKTETAKTTLTHTNLRGRAREVEARTAAPCPSSSVDRGRKRGDGHPRGSPGGGAGQVRPALTTADDDEHTVEVYMTKVAMTIRTVTIKSTYDDDDIYGPRRRKDGRAGTTGRQA